MPRKRFAACPERIKESDPNSSIAAGQPFVAIESFRRLDDVADACNEKESRIGQALALGRGICQVPDSVFLVDHTGQPVPLATSACSGEGHSICCASGNNSTICRSNHPTAARAGAGASESTRRTAPSGLVMRGCSRCLLLGCGVVENLDCCSAVRAVGCRPSDFVQLI